MQCCAVPGRRGKIHTHLSSKYCLHRARTCTPSISPAIGLPCRKPLRLVVREVADRGRRPSPQETHHKTFPPPPPECLARRAHMTRLGCSTARHDAGQNFDASILPSIGCLHPRGSPQPVGRRVDDERPTGSPSREGFVPDQGQVVFGLDWTEPVLVQPFAGSVRQCPRPLAPGNF